MATSSPPTRASPSRWWILIGVFALVLAGWLVIRNTSESPSSSSNLPPSTSQLTKSQAAGSAATTGKLDKPASPSAGEPVTTRSSLRRGDEGFDGASGENVVQFPHLERILADESLPPPQAAAALLEIAKRSELTEEERYEALAHGLNLDFPAFVALASDPSLPTTLAQRYLDELANQNQRPLLQIEGCLALMDHSDSSIRTQSAERLAFLVENEALADSSDELRQTAQARILEIKQSN